MPPDAVLAEVDRVAVAGFKEIALTGVHLGSYGRDLDPRTSLLDLLHELAGRSHDVLFRLSSLEPMDCSPSIVDLVARSSRFAPHFHLPLQHASNRMLAAMRRPYTIEQYAVLVDRVRERMPDASIGSDIIVGFPGETAEQYQRSLDLVADLRFDKVHCAAYSTRPGTAAARNLEDDVPPEEKARRLHEVDDLQERILGEINSALVGQDAEVLVEGRKKGKWLGRTLTDKLVFFDDPADRLGQLVNVTIQRTSPWSLQGSVALQQNKSRSGAPASLGV